MTRPTQVSLTTPRLIATLIALSMGFHVVALVLSNTVLSSWRFENYPTHIVFEVGGGVIGLLVSAILWSSERRGRGTSCNMIIASALAAMGILDTVHGLLEAGQAFVFLHSIATFIGGLLLVCVWLPQQATKIHGKLIFRISVMGSILLCVLATWAPETTPPMLDRGRFSGLAIFLNAGGGLLLLLAAVRLFLNYRENRNTDDLLFSLHCLLFGAAGIMFEQSVLWDFAWWGWHALRLGAYAVALWFAVKSDLYLDQPTRSSEQLGKASPGLFAAEFPGVPRWFVWTVVGACLMPTLLSGFGLNFSSPNINAEQLKTALAGNGETEAFFAALSGSYTHTLLEWSATAIAVFTALLAFIHFRLRRDVVTPIIGIALLTSGIVDAFHTLAANGLVSATANAQALIPFTWAISRTFNAVVPISALLLLFFARRFWELSSPRQSMTIVASATFGMALLAFLAIAYCLGANELPQTVFPNEAITRPWDVYPLAMYAASGILVYPLFKDQVRSGFSQALWLSVLPDIATQLHVAFGSTALFDHHFHVAHSLKIVAYLVPCAGLLFDNVATYRRAETSRQCFESTVEFSPVGMIAINTSSRIVLVNAETERLFGYPREELLSQPIEMLFPEQHPAGCMGYPSNFSKAPQTRKMGTGQEIFGRKEDGSEFPVDMAFSPLNVGQEQWTLSAVIDQTALRRSQQELVEHSQKLERSNAELQQFAYVSSHDLQEPLRMVASYTTLLRSRYEGHFDEKGDRYLGYVIEGATRMQALVDSLLRYSRVDATPQNPHHTDANAALDAALDNLKVRIQESGAQIERDRLPTVAIDPIHLTQLFQNLIGNGIKFHKSDAPRVKVFATPNGRDSWTFGVRDNGIGIKEEHHDRVFTIFKRLHQRSDYEGTGIGLSIAKKIVQRNGGKIWVESKYGEGSTFYFTLVASSSESGHTMASVARSNRVLNPPSQESASSTTHL